MKRGNIITVSAPGDYGKPRPAVVVQSNLLIDATDSVLVCLITSTLREAPLFRLTLNPNAINRLQITSQIMIEKIIALPKGKCGNVIGKLNDSELELLNKLLLVTLGIAD